MTDTAKMSGNTTGALLMMGSMAAFTANDAFMKAVGVELPLSQAVVLRGLPTVVMMVALAYVLGALRFDFSRKDWWLLTIRNATEVGAAYFFLTAIFNMPFANAVAILQVLPLSITLAGAVFLGEAVGWRRWTAILVGLVGVLLIIRPGFEGFTVYSLYALGSVACVTAREIVSRQLTREIKSITVALLNAAAVTAGFMVFALFETWVPVSGAVALNLGAASVFIIMAYICAVAAVRSGDLAVVAPFRYTSLLWAMAIGVVVFGEPLDALTVLGAAIVVVMGIYSFYRERALGKAAARASV